ncbi:MAG: biotin/lipoyl-binding protein, partial [Rhodothermales bacterium]
MPDLSKRTAPPDRTGSPERNGASPFERRTGEGVDRKVEKETFTPKCIALVVVALLLAGAVGYGLWQATSGGKRLNVERDKLTISAVEEGPFQEFIAITGTVTPLQTVYLDAVEGGRVEEVFVQEGAMVEKDEPLLRLSNNDLQLRLMQSEASLSEQVSNLQNMRFQV